MMRFLYFSWKTNNAALSFVTCRVHCNVCSIKMCIVCCQLF